jgi:hypothetical protein
LFSCPEEEVKQQAKDLGINLDGIHLKLGQIGIFRQELEDKEKTRLLAEENSEELKVERDSQQKAIEVKKSKDEVKKAQKE